MIYVTTAFGSIGLVDDYSKIKHKNSDGMSALTKYCAPISRGNQ